ncbi:hypothetical protein PENVUL_c001G07691 [Penicillium vulpinum]|uniref:F-box domain-containing protein n=1 Tax=Penicillium vulpinum TaxID=29845 RepID=A0A1V6SER9_9EURO|nr:hypothetical protein PENVUL_c001G07691 [Penicillium vulpinum]
MSAQDVALGTVEVLENILLHLDLQSILTSAQRVCHPWQDLISTSPSLQKHLFFRPDWHRKDKQPNPLLASTFPAWFSDLPTFKQQCKDDSIKIGRHGINSSWDLDQPSQYASFMGKNASWRRMLVQQPPIVGIAFFIVKESRGGKWLTGPYTSPPNNSVSNSLAVSDPLRMNQFVQIPRTGGIFGEGGILWVNEDHQIPSKFQNYPFRDKDIKILKEALEECEMIVFQWEVVQCVPRRNRAQIYKNKFFFPEEVGVEDDGDRGTPIRSDKRLRC